MLVHGRLVDAEARRGRHISIELILFSRQPRRSGGSEPSEEELVRLSGHTTWTEQQSARIRESVSAWWAPMATRPPLCYRFFMSARTIWRADIMRIRVVSHPVVVSANDNDDDAAY